MTRKATSSPARSRAGRPPASVTRPPAVGTTEEAMVVESVLEVSANARVSCAITETLGGEHGLPPVRGAFAHGPEDEREGRELERAPREADLHALTKRGGSGLREARAEAAVGGIVDAIAEHEREHRGREHREAQAPVDRPAGLHREHVAGGAISLVDERDVAVVAAVGTQLRCTGIHMRSRSSRISQSVRMAR